MIEDVSDASAGAPRSRATDGWRATGREWPMGGTDRDAAVQDAAIAGVPATTGSTQRLAELAGDTPATSIPEVIERLAQIRDYAASTSLLAENDGIASFTRLYHIIT